MPKTLAPVRPNAGVEASYRRKLDLMIDEMDRSISYWLRAAYRANEPVIAQDASPAAVLRALMRSLARRWLKRFDAAAPELAKWFAIAAADRSDMALRAILRRGGFSVKFKMTRAANDVMQATIGEQVGLIRSIAQQHLSEVEGLVMRSVQTGRDLSGLSADLLKRYAITKKRAALIARDQNNKATATITRVRQQELGITEAIWVHSHGGKTPRPSHVKAGAEKQRYKIAEGWYDPDVDEFIWPGTLINCRCVARSVVPGLERSNA